MLAACQQQRVDEPFARDQFALGALKFSTQKGVIESSVVNHKWSVANEGKKIVNDVDENAFIYCFPISQAKGGVLKKRPLHH